jgi:BlaI family penicillinase repressor
MRRPAQDVTEAELAVLQVLWDRDAATRRELSEALYPDERGARYTTVQKLLERLEAKGYVAEVGQQADSRQEPIAFRALVSRDELISRRLRAMADQLCDGSLTPLFVNLVRARRLTPVELAELRQFVESLKKQDPPRGKRR